MKRLLLILILIFSGGIQSGCSQEKETDFVIAFGSCNDQKRPNELWKDIIATQPDLWIWGGDNIYSDTDDPVKMKSDYDSQLLNEDYRKLVNTIPVMGTWDDHDYGKNDAGVEYVMKKESQQLFLDFLGVSKDDSIRKQEGIYTYKDFDTAKGSIRVIVLDTRYFRTTLTKGTGGKRYQPNKPGDGTILGKTQWKWLREALDSSKADFNIIVSSIQVLSGEHGFEKWANFPAERDLLFDTIANSGAKGVVILSGDRHISEFSRRESTLLPYPLIDFTSSGLTHAYRGFKGEPNEFRVGEVVFTESFGVLRFNFDEKKVMMEMRAKGNVVLDELSQKY
ncbi:alkaline phosphatase D family protein [Spongiivirga citrea]|uniref:Alkaline phosphatase family protein n=1 Tax=Spongiivirga citrea TaxID=1481457 RepID=A0A6M0CRS0_9FLAO|nr:alkaline phosphatase D family protein [Spongiivirga citrea]NER18549.1 alkaline phosphatase family protein [Spongiivirga citrea]